MEEIIEENESDEESLSGSDTDAETVIGVYSDVETLTDSDVESPVEGSVGSHTGARSKETKRTCKEEIYTDKYEDDDDDNDDFNYYNEDWTPENPFQTGTLKLHPNDPFYKRDLMENIELKEFQPEDISQRNKPKPEKYASFKKFHNDALAEVEKMDKRIKSFFANENNLERARFVLKLATSKALKLSPILGKKSETRARELEEMFYSEEKKNRKVALESISASIQLTNGNSYRNLAKRYIKRGDFLCRAQKYEEAFRDARRSLVYYDKLEDLMWSSYDTLAICYMEKRLWEKAKFCYRKSLRGIQECDISESTKATYIGMIENELKEIEEKIEQKKTDRETGENDKDIQKKDKEDMNKQDKDKQNKEKKEKSSHSKNYGIDNKVELPELTKDQHRDHKNVSSLVFCKYDNRFKRGLYATDDIEPGNVLVVEKSYASALYTSFCGSNCCICNKAVFNPIPCLSCENVWYCGEKCMSMSIVRHIHEHECKVLPYLRDPDIENLDIENMTLLTYRIITRFPWQKLKKYLPAINTSRSDLAEHFEQFDEIDDEHQEVVQKINMEIFFLKTNGEFREFDDLFKKSMASVYILECLRVGGYFKDDPPTREEKVKIVSIALKHMQAAKCNSNILSEYKIQTGSSVGIGSVIHPMVSLANHSCFPNVLRYYINNVCVLRAIRYIKKGQQIFDNYNTIYDNISREFRLYYLSNTYKFQCKCEACVRKWRLHNEHSEPLKFRCPEDKCTEIITFNLDMETECPRHGYKAKKISNLFNYVNPRVHFLYNACENLKYGKLDSITPLKELQIILDKYSLYPSEILNLCQTILRREFLREGNVCRTFE